MPAGGEEAFEDSSHDRSPSPFPKRLVDSETSLKGLVASPASGCTQVSSAGAHRRNGHGVRSRGRAMQVRDVQVCR